MASEFPPKVVAYIDNLLMEAQTAIDLQDGFKEPSTSCYRSIITQSLHLASILGVSNNWSRELKLDCSDDYHERYIIERLNGTLSGLRRTIDAGLINSISDLVRAEMFGDLLEQADYLFSEGYDLPAAVIGRAILEEHLRKLCIREGVEVTKPRPTIDDFRKSLYDGKKLDKVQSTHVTSMATVGNAAAHNQPVQKQDVERLLRDVRAFMALTSSVASV